MRRAAACIFWLRQLETLPYGGQKGAFCSYFVSDSAKGRHLCAAGRLSFSLPRRKVGCQMGQRETEDRGPVTEKEFSRILRLIDLMKVHLDKAIALSKQLNEVDLTEEDDAFWALVKYAENVQDSARQLDCMKLSILEALEEVPLKSEQGTDLNWKGLKGMRVILAHVFWNINKEILWETVIKDFPVLRILLSLLEVSGPSVDPESPKFSIPVKRFRTLPISEMNDEFTVGNSFIFMYFDNSGRAECLRIARVSETRLRFKPPSDRIVREMAVHLIDPRSGERENLGRQLY